MKEHEHANQQPDDMGHNMHKSMEHNHEHMGHEGMSGKENRQNMHSHVPHSTQGGHSGHGEHENHGSMGAGHMSHMGNLKRKFWISLILAIPIILLSPMMGMNLPFQISFPGSEWLVLVLASILFFYGGKPFLDGAKMELKDKNPAMMTLIAMGITVSYIYSLYAFISNNFIHSAEHKMDFFWELATLIVIMLLGHWIEMRAVGNAGDALQKMAELLPGSAHLMQADGNTKDVPLKEVMEGQEVQVKSGEKIPADGVVTSGKTTVNESMVTGEAKGVRKEEGAKVIGGSINGVGTITVKVTGTGESGYLAQVMKLVSQAQQEKSSAETLSDKVAKALFYVALAVGVIAFIVWIAVTGDLNTALERMVTVFIIACPHALGLAIPLVVARSTSIGASHGLLIRKRNVLEIAKKISVVTMDKTGTLTEGNFRVSSIKSFSDGWSEDDVLTTMAALEAGSNHPLSVGILNAAKDKNITIPKADSINQISGVGLSGRVKGKDVKIVTEDYLKKHNLLHDDTLFKELAKAGNSVSYLLVEDKVVGLVAQGDHIKDEARSTVAELKKQNIKPVMLTGDNEAAANAVAEQLGIIYVHASLLPDNKESIIKQYQEKGDKVMMVGDGVNDAPSLARADIGVAIGAGTDVAIDSADVVLVKSNPSDILHLLSLAKRTMRKMVQNLWWGAGYNIIAIPLAAGVLAPIGIVLSPAVGAILMSISTVVVAINALMLRMK